MRFSKMHGLGNDFVLVNGFTETLPTDLNAFAVKVCDRHLGIGADGLLVLSAADSANACARFSIYNSDGSEAGMCGNGVRCAALFAKKEGIMTGDTCVFDVKHGQVSPCIVDAEKGIVHGGHTSLFDIDEDAIWRGAACLAQTAWDYLEENK